MSKMMNTDLFFAVFAVFAPSLGLYNGIQANIYVQVGHVCIVSLRQPTDESCCLTEPQDCFGGSGKGFVKTRLNNGSFDRNCVHASKTVVGTL